MGYIDNEKEFREWAKLSEEEKRKILNEKSKDYTQFVYGGFLPVLKELEQESRKRKIIVGYLEKKVA